MLMNVMGTSTVGSQSLTCEMLWLVRQRELDQQVIALPRRRVGQTGSMCTHTYVRAHACVCMCVEIRAAGLRPQHPGRPQG